MQLGEESLSDEGTAEGREKQSGGYDLTEKKTRYINAELDLKNRWNRWNIECDLKHWRIIFSGQGMKVETGRIKESRIDMVIDCGVLNEINTTVVALRRANHCL